MLTGVEILLERMKTNPEEFIEGGFSKWSRVIDSAWSILTEEEQTALKAGVDNAKREHFNGEVMRVLAGHVDSTTYQEVMRIDSSGNLGVGTAIAMDKQYTTGWSYPRNIPIDKNAKTKTPRTPKA
jgi:hypothetical protein